MLSRIAVLASGTGSNLQAILDHLAAIARAGEASALPVRVELVASDRPTAGALAVARQMGIPGRALDDPSDGEALVRLLEEHGIELVALAGYLKRIPDGVTHRYRGHLLNVHPALLPAFGGPGMYGTRVHQAVLDAGVRLTGATVHFVDEHYDHGPIIAQWPVPVLTNDTVATLGARVLQVEHRLYPCAVGAVVSGRVKLRADGRVEGQVLVPPDAPEFSLQSEHGEPACRS